MAARIAISLESPIPLVEQIVAGVREVIALGEIAPGDSLPTVRQLAADLGVNMNTVARAYRALEGDGLVQTRRGRGTTVAASAEAPARDIESIRAELAARTRDALASARLGGLSRDEARDLLLEQMDLFWDKE